MNKTRNLCEKLAERIGGWSLLEKERGIFGIFLQNDSFKELRVIVMPAKRGKAIFAKCFPIRSDRYGEVFGDIAPFAVVPMSDPDSMAKELRAKVLSRAVAWYKSVSRDRDKYEHTQAVIARTKDKLAAALGDKSYLSKTWDDRKEAELIVSPRKLGIEGEVWYGPKIRLFISSLSFSEAQRVIKLVSSIRGRGARRK